MIPHTNKIEDVNSWLYRELESVSDKREVEQFVRILNEDVLHIQQGIDQDTQRISESQIIELQNCVKRLKSNEPIQYVTGKTHFYNLVLDIGPGALVPRPETEELVDLVVKNSGNEDAILDLCSGSGCIALAIKKALPASKVIGLERHQDAIKHARLNGINLSLHVEWLENDVFEDDWFTEHHVFQTIVSNPPYIPNGEKKMMNDRVVNFEPHEALFVSDHDPLKFYKRIGELGRKLLPENGNLICEGHEHLMGNVKKLWLSLGYSSVDILKDMQGKDRIAWAKK